MQYLPILAFALVYGAAAFAWGVPAYVGVGYLVASLLCFAAYALDKSAARSRERRTPERTLLLLGLAGGWPGAVLAQQWLRHKSAKTSFRLTFWATVLANAGLFLYAAFTFGRHGMPL
jgi:uncharacterized membrane protein YsdA (DUF1294 family)